ncbi:MAG TPA: type IV pilin [Methanocorpusculum sp.]|nr:type IV pilin [Methanocorpusculum sp.]HJJ40265.1 type IV pilin [Methanocorpusculum sp.]HJJ49654.1 type IV pilin [Methanocorpusculum sp.]HJJ57798.1 type IV pilin [Methanocorpusculum sp.]
MKRTENKENAVSPVVGVMLMLVVTIVIAAVVTLFATGVVTSTEKAPVAVLDVNIYKSALVNADMLPYTAASYAPDFTIDHIAGDPLKTSDLKITVDWETNDPVPKKVTNIFTGSPGPIEYHTTQYDESWAITGAKPDTKSQPLYVNDQSLNTNQVWGKATLTVGGHVQTYANYLNVVTTGEIIHSGSPFFDAVMGKPDGDSGASYKEATKNHTGGAAEKLAVGTLVHVVITHVPSGSILFDKEVRVQ